METETKTPSPVVEVAKAGPHWFTVRTGHMSLMVTPADLQAIVQAAYDTAGIVAEPSLDVELRRLSENAEVPDLLREFADRWGQSLRGQS